MSYLNQLSNPVSLGCWGSILSGLSFRTVVAGGFSKDILPPLPPLFLDLGFLGFLGSMSITVEICKLLSKFQVLCKKPRVLTISLYLAGIISMSHVNQSLWHVL